MKNNRMKGFIIILIIAPTTLLAVPNRNNPPADVEGVFLNAVEQMKSSAVDVNPNIDEVSLPTASYPAHPDNEAPPVRPERPAAAESGISAITSAPNPTTPATTARSAPVIELPEPQLNKTILSEPANEPILAPATTENSVPANTNMQITPPRNSKPAPIPASLKEKPMSYNFLNNTTLLLAIGIALMALGVLLLIWLLWPRAREQYPSATPAPEKPQPLAEPEFEFDPVQFAEAPDLKVEPKPQTPIEVQESLKLSELEDFEQLMEEEHEYLNLKQEPEDDEGEYSFMESKDAIPVKLDLARAYLEMGDYDAVNATLKSVLVQGSKAQQREAELLLEQARLAQGD